MSRYLATLSCLILAAFSFNNTFSASTEYGVPYTMSQENGCFRSIEIKRLKKYFNVAKGLPRDNYTIVELYTTWITPGNYIVKVRGEKIGREKIVTAAGRSVDRGFIVHGTKLEFRARCNV